jgi:hypothetical protein
MFQYNNAHGLNETCFTRTSCVVTTVNLLVPVGMYSNLPSLTTQATVPDNKSCYTRPSCMILAANLLMPVGMYSNLPLLTTQTTVPDYTQLKVYNDLLYKQYDIIKGRDNTSHTHTHTHSNIATLSRTVGPIRNMVRELVAYMLNCRRSGNLLH